MESEVKIRRWWRKYFRQEEMWWLDKKEETLRERPDCVSKVRENHPWSEETDQEWSEEVAELEPTVQPEEYTSFEQVDLGMLGTADETKWENQMPKLKVVDA